jgi:IS5 family transposase
VGRSGLSGTEGADPRRRAGRKRLHESAISLSREDNEIDKAKNRTKSQVRAKVEHVIGVIKRVFGFSKVRYRGLAKNLHRLEVTAALANLFMVDAG